VAVRRRAGATKPPAIAIAMSAPKPGTARTIGPAMPSDASRSVIAPGSIRRALALVRSS
jgi:hypothetical protein